MSSPYDPRRSRPRPAAVPDPEAAPIEALLGPEPERGADQLPQPDTVTGSDESPAERDARAPRPMPAPRAGAPSAVLQLAPLLVLAALAAAVVWWLTRRGRSDG